MSETGDYTPAPQWSGHDFASARRAYNQQAGRSYAVAQATGATAAKLLPATISTVSGNPLIIDTDFTGSMDGWDATIFSKFPYLDHEIRTEYLSDDAEISFGAICDTGDEYPLQVRPFAKGADMKETLTELVHASGGSGPGSCCEAHGLAVLYRLRNTKMPKALGKPVYIIITDEKPYNLVTAESAATHAKVTIEQAMTSEEIFAEAMAEFSLYVILKPYGSERLSGDRLPATSQTVYDCWEKLVGADRIALLPDPERVVDVIFGILAKETDKIAYFRNELEQRQLPDKGGKAKVETVYKSLKTVHALPKHETTQATTGHSKTRGVGGGKPAKPLLP